MYSIQNFAKWLNGRGVNGYKKFSKIIQIPNGEYVGFYVANVSSSAIGTTTFYKILGVWSMEGALPRCNNSSSISIDVSVSKDGRVELVDITVDEERQHIGIGYAGLSYLKEFLSFVVDGYTKIYGHMCPDEKTPEGYAKLAAFYRKNNFVVDDITNQIEYIPKKPQ